MLFSDNKFSLEKFRILLSRFSKMIIKNKDLTIEFRVKTIKWIMVLIMSMSNKLMQFKM